MFHLKVLLEVVKDLLVFARETFLPWGHAKNTLAVTKLNLPPAALAVLLTPPHSQEKLVAPSNDKVETVLAQTSLGYVCRSETGLMQRPLWAYDGVLQSAKYGQALEFLGFEGRFAHVKLQDQYGWILKDDLVFSSNAVYPTLTPGQIYLADNVETKKLRKYIGDEFFTANLYLPLLGIEYVYYRFARLGVPISFGEQRPREAGDLHNQLRGVLGVAISITPKTGSLLEYYDDNGVGQLAYVESVTPDETVRVSCVGRLQAGQYEEIVLPKSVWQSYRPVWLAFS